MRYLSLKIQAFGPYDEAVTFPLEKLPGLFTITGDTGAGKSTLFDALAFALFGEMSSDSRKVKNARCTFSPDFRRTEVTLRFFHVDKEYTVTRWFNMDDGKLTPDAKLVADGVRESGHKKVKEAIENLIHLKAEQFRMVAVLPQGEFSKLLKAKQDDRAAIIKAIFNTGRFGKYVTKLKENSEAARDERAACRTEIIAKASPIKTDSEELNAMVTALATDTSAVYDLGRIIEFLGVQNDSDAGFADAFEKELERLKTEADEHRKAYDAAEKLLEKQKSLRTLEDTSDALDHQKKEIEALETATVRSETAVNYLKPMAEALDAAIGKLDGCRAAIDEIDKKKGELASELIFAKGKTEAVRQERDGHAELKNEKLSLENSLPDYEKADTQRGLKAEAEAKIRDIGHQLEQYAVSKEGLAKELGSNNELLEKIKGAPEQLQMVSNELEKAGKEKESLDALLGSVRKYVKDKGDVADTYKMWSVKNGKFLEIQEESKLAHDQFMEYQYGIIARDKLEAGKPCPVCGSCVHDHPAHAPDNTVSDADLKKLDAKVKAIQTEVEKLKSELDTKQGALVTSLSNIRNEAVRLGVEIESADAETAVIAKITEVGERIGELNNKVAALAEDVEKIGSISDRNSIIDEEVGKLNDVIQTLGVERSGLEIQISAATAVLSTLELKYANKAEAEAQINNLDRQITAFENAVTAAEQEEERINMLLSAKIAEYDLETGHFSEFKTDAESCRERFGKALVQENFASREEYEACLTTAEKLGSDRKKIQEYNEKVLSNSTLLGAVRDELAGMQIPESTDGMKEAMEESQRRYDEANRNVALVKDRLKKNKAIYNELTVLKDRFDRLDAYANSATHVYSVAMGGEGHTKMSYDAYVQEQYFQTIVEDAAARFFELSGETYCLYSKSAEGESMDKNNLKLWIRDLENGGERVIDSLSGGETFLASLSLALGMADMIQRCAGGKSIETLLIDEGFGTLDKDALSKSIKHLGIVAGNSGSIGLITHLDNLIAAIPKRVEITKEAGKGSKVEIY